MFINNDCSVSNPSHSTHSFIWFICNYWSKKQYIHSFLDEEYICTFLSQFTVRCQNRKSFSSNAKVFSAKGLHIILAVWFFWRCKASLYPSISLSSPFFFHPTYNEIRFLLISFHASVSIFTFSCHRTIDIDASACCFIVY